MAIDLSKLMPQEFWIRSAERRVRSTVGLVKRIFTLIKDEAKFRKKAVRDDYKKLIEDAEKEAGIEAKHAYDEYWENEHEIDGLKSKLRKETWDKVVLQE